MVSQGNPSGFFAARPSITLNDQDKPDLSNGLLTLLVEETTEGLYRCEATFGNFGNADGSPGFLYFDRQELDFGKTLAVRSGQGEAARQIFKGAITGLEAHYPKSRPPELMVLAEDRFQDLRMTRRTRTFDRVTDSDVMQQLASQHGLRADVDVNGPTHAILAQVNQSDLAFLRERARVVDAEVWIEDDTLHAQQRGRRNAGSVTLTYNEELIEFSVLADLAGQRSSLSVSGWSVASKSGIEYQATQAAIGGELNGYQSGSSVLESAFGQRHERIVHMVPLTDQEAQSLAEARYRTMARRFVTGRGLASGDGRIKVGAEVELRGLGTLFSGSYYVTEARHTFDVNTGHQTVFAVERPGIGQA
jgi:phage protein D